MTTIYIDDIAYEVEDGKNVLDAALSAGLDLPYFCWHPEMGSVGACRQCAVVQYRDEDDTQGRIVMGCMTAVTDGARFSLQGEKASGFRENIVESLMLNHPHDCPVCAEGGECHLQDMTVMVGHRDRRYRGKKNTHRNQYLGPLINHEMNRCIACYRCTRFYRDYAGGTDLSAQAAHDHVYFGRHEEGTLESEFAGNLVEVCPTGVFTDKPLVNDYTRKWDMQSAPSVCGGCALGCNTIPGERYGELKRVHNRFNHDVNGYFLCDRGRYGHDYVNNPERPSFAGLKDADGRFNAIHRDEAIETLKNWIKESTQIVGIGSPRASLESNFLLSALVGEENFCAGIADHEATLTQTVFDTLRQGSVTTPSLREVESADAVLVLGEDVTNTAPRLALSLRQAVRNRAKSMAADLRIPEWQDEAVRTLAQDALSPIILATPGKTKLEDIAEAVVHRAPSELANFGYAVASAIDASLPPPAEHLDETLTAAVKVTAEALMRANAPLIVCGTGAGSKAIIDAASAVAHALRRREGGERTRLSLCLAEANTLGSTMLTGHATRRFSELVDQASEIDLLIILENDLSRRVTRSDAQALLAAKRVVVIDALPNATMEQADLMLPAATLIESEGTLVSSEGRAQRHFPVFLAADDRAPSWQWLTRVGQALGQRAFQSIQHFDDVAKLCAESQPRFGRILEAAPDAEYRNHGLKIPRQPHRYSGRTAMRANISVHEPKQPEDSDSPLAFTMEGRNGSQPGALLPFVWSPGWNSNQSLHKFQSEVGGAIKGGTAGVRLIEANKASNFGRSVDQAENHSPAADGLRVIPLYRIFGSEELSSACEAIRELIDAPTAFINPADAQTAGLSDGETRELDIDGEVISVVMNIDESLPAGNIGLIVGLPSLPLLEPGKVARITLTGGAHV